MHNESLIRYKGSLNNDELESEYKRLPDDILNKYLKAYFTIKENNIDIPLYSNEKLDAEVDRISEYNEELNRKYMEDKEAKNAEIIDSINESLDDDNDTETKDTTDYSDRIIQ